MCSNPGSNDHRILPTYEVRDSTYTIALPTMDEASTVSGEQVRKSMAHLKLKPRPLQYNSKSANTEQAQTLTKNGSNASTRLDLSEKETICKNDGYAESTSKDGTKYAGGWKNGEKHGYGEEEYPDGSKFLGNFSNNQKNGFGIQIYADGSTYEGNWSGGLKHGKGKQTNKDGTMYDGQWQFGKKDGYGIYKSLDGQCYSGEFKDDLPNGIGVFAKPTGERVRGFWLQGNYEQSPSAGKMKLNITGFIH